MKKINPSKPADKSVTANTRPFTLLLFSLGCLIFMPFSTMQAQSETTEEIEVKLKEHEIQIEEAKKERETQVEENKESKSEISHNSTIEETSAQIQKTEEERETQVEENKESKSEISHNSTIEETSVLIQKLKKNVKHKLKKIQKLSMTKSENL